MSARIERGFNWPEHHAHCTLCSDCAPVVELVTKSTCAEDDHEEQTMICLACAAFVVELFRSRYGDEDPRG